MQRRIDGSTLTCLLLVPFLLCVFPIVNYDMGFHLQAGEWIWSQAEIPTSDPFSYTAAGQPWVDSHWLFQLLVYGVHGAAGLSGLVMLRAALVTGTYGFVLATCRQPGALGAAVAITTLTVFASFGRFLLRPELVSMLLLACFFCLAENGPRFPRTALLGVFVGQVVWANAHGLHPLGVAFLALYVAGDALQRAAHRRNPRIWSDVRRDELRLRAGLLACAVAGSLLNANGVAGILYPLSLLLELRGEVDWYPPVRELRPPTHFFRWLVPDPILSYFALVGVSALSLLVGWRRLRLAHLLPWLFFLYLSTLAMRNIPLFATVAAPVSIRCLLHGIPGRIAARAPRLLTPLCTAALAVVVGVSAASGSLYRHLDWRDRRFAISETSRYPERIIDHLRTVEGNVWSSSDLGGHLIWKLWPAKRVGIDGRWEVYGERLPALRAAYEDPEVFDRLVREHDIRAVLLGLGKTETRRMLPWLSQLSDWELTMRGPTALLFERKGGRG